MNNKMHGRGIYLWGDGRKYEGEYPEAAFNLVGTIEDAIEKGKKLMAETK